MARKFLYAIVVLVVLAIAAMFALRMFSDELAEAALVPTTDDKTFYVYGWSDQALSFVSMASQGWGTFVDVVRNGSL